MKIYQFLLSILAFCIYLSDGSKILAIYPFEGVSHKAVLQKIGLLLVNKGHQIDVISHFPLKNSMPNYTDVVHLPVLNKPWSADWKYLSNPQSKYEDLAKLVDQFCSLLEEPFLQKLLKNKNIKPLYDLVLIHSLNGFQCFPALGHVWNIPVVAVVTTSPYPRMYNFVDQPFNLALYPSYVVRYNKRILNFWERLNNVITTSYDLYQFDSATGSKQQHYLKKYFGPSIPHYKDLEKIGTSLMLTNSHHSFNGIKPKSAKVIEIGGIHLENDTSTMDKNLKEFLDQSRSGFIYLSLGTLIRIETFPKEIINRLYEAFRKISPVRVVFRVPDPEAMPKNHPKNTFVHKWLPQQLILQHPKLRVFIGHGGIHGIQEALFYAVPMICVPFFADQTMNCDLVQINKFGLRLDYQTAQQEDYDFALKEILNNPLYKESAQNISAKYKDRPRTPSEEAVYWIEYVIRHGKNVLKSPAAELVWWQIDLVDVYAFILVCFLLILAILISFVRLILVRLKNLISL